MLLLTRRIGESVVIGDEDVRLTILGIKGNQVRLGIAAPADISVHREEVFLKIKNENTLSVDGNKRCEVPNFLRKCVINEKELNAA